MIKGIYIHIPFCNIKCPYCDFTSFVWQEDSLKDRYVEALKKELLMYLDNEFDIQTIYFGGGTPSTLKPEKIAEIIEFIKNKVNHQENLEITVEINPKNYGYQEFKILKDAKVSRISIGNQSFLEKNLINLGRDHKPKDSLKTVEDCLKAGISNINLDLIYAVQNQTLQDLEKDLEVYTSLPITHISAYMLTAYEDTPLGNLVEKGLYSLPEEDLVYYMFLMIDQTLHEKGFKRYELSNWAKEGFECKHNLFYWTDVNFLGIGISAWSYVDNERFGNTKNINEYLENVEKGQKPVKYRETLDENKKYEEAIFLGLRLRKGVNVELIKNKEILDNLVKEGYGKIENRNFYLLPKGIMVINEIARKLLY